MFTKNYEKMLCMIPEYVSNTTYGSISAVNVYGITRYLSIGAYVILNENEVTTDPNAAGISIGKGSRPATVDDFQLEDTITSGVNIIITSTKYGVINEAPYKKFEITVTNTGNEALTISEIGYKSKSRAIINPGTNGNTASDGAFLVERTVFDTPIVIQAGDAGVITYTLGTKQIERYKNGVKLVSFSFGSDEDVSTMIDAARNGIIDLQEDGGWRVSDVRTIELDAWVGGGDTAHAQQYANIIISQFGDYNNCGCLFQFDFVNCSLEKQRMNSTSSASGYSSTEMYTTTLPAMVEALPSWLKTRLKTFDVLAENNSELETVSGNKLALRAIVEILGITPPDGLEGEGELVDIYSLDSSRKFRGLGKNFTSRDSYVTRSGLTSTQSSGQFYYISSTSWGITTNIANGFGLVPFGCI